MANTMELMTINQVEPIYVTFSVPEAQLAAIKRYMATGQPVGAGEAAGRRSGGEESGKLTFVDNSVDATTGTIKLKGTFPNTNRKLWPGQFVRVTLRLTTQPNAVVVPNQAVQTGQNGSFVYVVKPDKTVESRPVTTGARVDQDMVMERLGSGRDGGDRRPVAPGSGQQGKHQGRQRTRGRRRPRTVAGLEGARREFLGNLHPAADRHQPADGWRSRCSA